LFPLKAKGVAKKKRGFAIVKDDVKRNFDPKVRNDLSITP